MNKPLTHVARVGLAGSLAIALAAGIVGGANAATAPLKTTVVSQIASGEISTSNQTIWGTTAPAAALQDADTKQVELGTKFTAVADAQAVGVRFFKTDRNLGTHTGTLWSSAGSKLATVTFTNETATGWQTANFSSPVTLKANSSYVVSYNAPQGRYAATNNFTGKSSSSLVSVPSSNAGVYKYGTGLPTSTWMSSQYWVDVVVRPTAGATTPAPAPAPAPAPTPAPAPAPTPAPGTSTGATTLGIATNTGVPAGTALTVRSGDLTVTQSGTVIDAMDLRGTLTINASNVTVKRTKVTSGGWNVIKVSPSAKNVVIEDVTVVGLGMSGSENSFGIYGPATVRRANISGVENGVVPGSGSLITGSYIHSFAAPGSPHYDGIQIDGGLQDITVEYTTINLAHGQTAAVMVDNYFGAISNIKVTNNRLLGGGYTVYADGQFSTTAKIVGVTFANNRIGGGTYGPSLIRNAEVTWTGNVNDSTGKAI